MAEKSYTTEAMINAIEAVARGATTSSAAREFKVPRTTLIDKINGRSSINCSKGPPTILTEKEEEHLENWLIFMANSGFPVTKEQLQDSVSILVKKLDRENPFRNGKPGRHWFEAFVKRHPIVGQRVAQNLTQTRALVKEENIRTWFKEIEEYFTVAELKEASEDPRRTFNCDESAFFLSPTDNKVLAKRGSKNVYNVIPSGERECVTVLITANAAGELAPPMVLYKLKSIPYKIAKRAPANWGLGHSPKGWMTGEAFYEYITNVFFPWVERNNIQLPIIFFLDGHCSHTTLPLSNFCREKKIILIALYPNATHLLQPMDVSVFRPLKRIWKKTVYDWRNKNQFVKLKKENFCPLLQKALKELDPSTITNGFRKTGLSPFNADNVDYTKCLTSNLKPSSKVEEHSQANNDHLRFFESQISPTKLKAFSENKGSKWLGDESLQGLFTVWRRMKNQVCGTDEHQKRATSLSKQTSDENNHLANNDNQRDETKIEAKQNLQTAELTNENHTLGFGNFTGFSNILESNCSLNDLSEINITDVIHENMEAKDTKIEIFEVIDGELTKITPDPSSESLINSYAGSLEVISDSADIFNTLLQPKLHTPVKFSNPVTSTFTTSTAQVIRTTGSKPLYLTQNCQIFPPDAILDNNDRVTILSSEIVSTDTIPDDKIQKQFSEDEKRHDFKKFYGDLIIPTPFKDALFWPEVPPCPTKTKIKIPSVITSDRWQIFSQKKNDIKKEKDKRKAETKIRKNIERQKKVITKKTTGPPKVANKDWYCRMCKTCAKLDMIQCLSCKVWYHTSCAEVQPTELSFHCLYCDV